MDCLESLMAQDYAGRMEIIVVEQGRRRPHEVLNFFFFLHRRRIIRIQQQEPNLPRARNAGIAVARGEVLLFIDDDVILPSDGISRLAEHFRGAPIMAVTGLILSEIDREGSLRAYARRFSVAGMEEASAPIEVGGFIGALMMVSAKAVREVGGFDPRLGMLTPTAYGEDDDFCYRLRRAGVPLFIDPSVRALHRDQLAGGCGSRRTDPDLALTYHMKSMAYIRIKHHGRLGAGGWLQLARGFIANREILRNRPGQAVLNFMAARKAVDEVRAFMAGRGVEAKGPRFIGAERQLVFLSRPSAPESGRQHQRRKAGG